jgi:peptidoglycan-N-acetylglucosamine deacetylase
MKQGQDPETTPGLSRRRLLGLGVLAASAGALAVPAAAITEPSARSEGRARPPRPAARPAAVPSDDTPLDLSAPQPPPELLVAPKHFTVVPPPTRPAPPVHPIHRPSEPAWVHTWDAPISRLDDFVARSGDHYARNAIMLTIDDGPHPVWTPKYLRLLARHHVRATFCVIGAQVREYPHLVKAAVSEGHHIANHTYRHPLNLPHLRPHRIQAELEDTTDAVVRASGFRPRQFRAPGGVWGARVFAEVSRQQMMPLGWDIDPRDWALPGVAHIRQAMLASRPHDIILCHDGGGNRAETYAALETVVPALVARGWHFVTLPAPTHI